MQPHERCAKRRNWLPFFATPSDVSCFAGWRDGSYQQITFKPDTLVYCGLRHSPDVIEVPDPLIVCEVLSPDSLERDLGEKLEGYFTMASLQHSLIVDPDRQRVIHHRRGSGEDLITRIPKSGALALELPGLTLNVSDHFERTGLV